MILSVPLRVFFFCEGGEAGGGVAVDSVGRALEPASPSVSATLIACGGIDLWWVQGHCTRSSCLPTLASRQGPVNHACGWAGAG